MENHADGETFGRSQVDHLPFALPIRSISSASVGETKMSRNVEILAIQTSNGDTSHRLE